jgi:hypothetical protein
VQPLPVSPMLLFFVVLFLLPIKMAPAQLKLLAFALWLIGGLILCWFGYLRITEGQAAGGIDPNMMVGVIVAALVIGIAKGKFVLSKTSQRNIERIDAMTEPQKPMYVYSTKSWITIAVMVLLGVALNQGWIPLDLFWRGAVNLGIGSGLIISSLKYLRTLSLA